MLSMLFEIFVEQVEGISLVLMCTTFCFMALVLHFILLVRSKSKKEKVNIFHEAVLILLLFSYCFLFQITYWCREPGSRIDAVLVPFSRLLTSAGEPNYRMISYAFFNVLLFVPFGILWTFLKCQYKFIKRLFIVTAYGFITTLCVEMIQYISQRGYFETEDIICNTVGTVAGFIIASPCIYAYKLLMEREKE